MKEVITIEVDILSGSVDFKTSDTMTYFNALGAIEFTKAMIIQRLIEHQEDDDNAN